METMMSQFAGCIPLPKEGFSIFKDSPRLARGFVIGDFCFATVGILGAIYHLLKRALFCEDLHSLLFVVLFFLATGWKLVGYYKKVDHSIVPYYWVCLLHALLVIPSYWYSSAFGIQIDLVLENLFNSKVLLSPITLFCLYAVLILFRLFVAYICFSAYHTPKPALEPARERLQNDEPSGELKSVQPN